MTRFAPIRTCFRAERLRVQRELLELSQLELGQVVGVSRTAIAMIETRRSEPSLTTLCGLARALDCTTDWLLGLDEDDGR